MITRPLTCPLFSLLNVLQACYKSFCSCCGHRQFNFVYEIEILVIIYALNSVVNNWLKTHHRSYHQK